jgi:hypothetical protein
VAERAVAARAADVVLTEHDHRGVVLHLLRERLVERLEVGENALWLGHGVCSPQYET